jgi:hypothetical protein
VYQIGEDTERNYSAWRREILQNALEKENKYCSSVLCFPYLPLSLVETDVA